MVKSLEGSLGEENAVQKQSPNEEICSHGESRGHSKGNVQAMAQRNEEFKETPQEKINEAQLKAILAHWKRKIKPVHSALCCCQVCTNIRHLGFNLGAWKDLY